MTGTEMQPATYRKKQVEIQAFQLLDHPACVRAVAEWINSEGGEASIPFASRTDNLLVILTLEGDMRAGDRDWIIRGVRGEFYPCKPDIFDLTYEAIDSPVDR